MSTSKWDQRIWQLRMFTNYLSASHPSENLPIGILHSLTPRPQSPHSQWNGPIQKPLMLNRKISHILVNLVHHHHKYNGQKEKIRSLDIWRKSYHVSERPRWTNTIHDTEGNNANLGKFFTNFRTMPLKKLEIIFYLQKHNIFKMVSYQRNNSFGERITFSLSSTPSPSPNILFFQLLLDIW